MIETSMVSTTEECNINSPMTSNPYLSTKFLSARKPLRQFSKTLDVKKKTAVCRVSAPKENHKVTKQALCCGQTFTKCRVHTKNKSKFQRSFLRLDSTSSLGCAISNWKWLSLCLYWWQPQKVINGKVVIASFLHELHNRMVIPSEEGGMTGKRDEYNIFIIND